MQETLVRIYDYYDSESLADRIKFMMREFEIIDIKYSISFNGALTKYSALVIFKEKICEG